MTGKTYNFNYGWQFKLADAFPLRKALAATADTAGHAFYESGYAPEGWEAVALPHTYNDKDLFVNRIEDAGSNQKRTFSCYRKTLHLDEEQAAQKIFLEFEGIRQTCYLYVNGTLAGYYEAGIAPFGFDLSPYVHVGENLIAVATDSTSSRNLDYFGAETPNLPGAEPGSFITSLTVPETIPAAQRGTGFFWNCNDFNPCVGGLSKNVRLHIKPKAYLTLPLYRNLRTKGCYVWADDFDLAAGSARIHVQAEVKNETDAPKALRVRVQVLEQQADSAAGKSTECRTKATCACTAEKRTDNQTAQGNANITSILAAFDSSTEEIAPAADRTALPPLSIVPKDAYVRMPDGSVRALPEHEVKPVETASACAQTISTEQTVFGLRFWDPQNPQLYTVRIELLDGDEVLDTTEIRTGFRKVEYSGETGLYLNGHKFWLRGYAQRATNEWAAIGAAPDWLKDMDAQLIRESNANHIRFMHVAGCPADIRSFDRYGVVCTQPAGDKEKECFDRQWKQRVEAMRDVIIYFRNSPSILFWEAGNNSISKEHMREMRLLKEALDPAGGRFMGCRTLNTEEVVAEAEYVGTMLNRHAARFISKQMPITETEYLREEAPRRIWDDFTPPDYDYDTLWLGKGGRKQVGGDYYDLTSEDLATTAAREYQEYFNDRVGGASGKDFYSACAALCWTDSAQHGRQSHSENARMSGRVDPVRIKKQNFYVFRTMQSETPAVYIVGHWNYPKQEGNNYRYAKKEFNGQFWVKTGEYGFRNPKDKTVYVIGSYQIQRVELFINGVQAGSCDQPDDSFVFAFPHIDITQSGVIEAKGYGYDGQLAAEYRTETAGAPAKLRLHTHTGASGLLADGEDIAYVDVEVLDAEGRLCPLCDARIDFETEGDCTFLGGYNSGCFNGYGKADSVIHQRHVFAECGNNRVFLRGGTKPGIIRLRAHMDGVPDAEVVLESRAAETGELVLKQPQRLSEGFPAGMSGIFGKAENNSDAGKYMQKSGDLMDAEKHDEFPAIPAADKQKYTPSDKLYCKVLVNGQEPDTHRILSIVDHGAIYSPILPIIERMKQQKPEAFDYSYDPETETLTISSDGTVVTAKTGRTHLLVNGEENLLNGQPYLNEDGVLIVEINAIIGYIHGVKAWYDDKVNVFRIEW